MRPGQDRLRRIKQSKTTTIKNNKMYKSEYKHHSHKSSQRRTDECITTWLSEDVKNGPAPQASSGFPRAPTVKIQHMSRFSVYIFPR